MIESRQQYKNIEAFIGKLEKAAEQGTLNETGAIAFPLMKLLFTSFEALRDVARAAAWILKLDWSHDEPVAGSQTLDDYLAQTRDALARIEEQAPWLLEPADE